MPQKSSSTGSKDSNGSKSKASGGRRGKSSSSTNAGNTAASPGLAGFTEQLANRVIKPLGLVLMTRERIQETLDEAAERGRVTRTDANELAAELFKRGRQETDDLLSNVEQLLGRGRQQLESATRRARENPVARLVGGRERENSAERPMQTFPILDYDEMTAGQVEVRLEGLTPAELRAIRNYERRHANRKSVLAAIERGLA